MRSSKKGILLYNGIKTVAGAGAWRGMVSEFGSGRENGNYEGTVSKIMTSWPLGIHKETISISRGSEYDSLCVQSRSMNIYCQLARPFQQLMSRSCCGEIGRPNVSSLASCPWCPWCPWCTTKSTACSQFSALERPSYSVQCCNFEKKSGRHCGRFAVKV